MSLKGRKTLFSQADHDPKCALCFGIEFPKGDNELNLAVSFEERRLLQQPSPLKIFLHDVLCVVKFDQTYFLPTVLSTSLHEFALVSLALE